MKSYELAKLLLAEPNMEVWMRDHAEGNDAPVVGMTVGQPPTDSCNSPKNKLDDVVFIE